VHRSFRSLSEKLLLEASHARSAIRCCHHSD
jgi:hypothetical protein